MQIDSKDLLPLDLTEFRFGGYFYFEVTEGDFALMKITEKMIEDWAWKQNWRNWLKANKEKLFTYREGKWCTLSGLQPDWEIKIIPYPI